MTSLFSEKRRSAQGIAQNGARNIIFRIRNAELVFVSHTEGFETAPIPAEEEGFRESASKVPTM